MHLLLLFPLTPVYSSTVHLDDYRMGAVQVKGSKVVWKLMQIHLFLPFPCRPNLLHIITVRTIIIFLPPCTQSIPRVLKHYDTQSCVSRLHVWVFQGKVVMADCWVKELCGHRNALSQESRFILASCLEGDLLAKMCQTINRRRIDRAQDFHCNLLEKIAVWQANVFTDSLSLAGSGNRQTRLLLMQNLCGT